MKKTFVFLLSIIMTFVNAQEVKYQVYSIDNIGTKSGNKSNFCGEIQDKYIISSYNPESAFGTNYVNYGLSYLYAVDIISKTVSNLDLSTLETDKAKKNIQYTDAFVFSDKIILLGKHSDTKLGKRVIWMYILDKNLKLKSKAEIYNEPYKKGFMSNMMGSSDNTYKVFISISPSKKNLALFIAKNYVNMSSEALFSNDSYRFRGGASIGTKIVFDTNIKTIKNEVISIEEKTRYGVEDFIIDDELNNYFLLANFHEPEILYSSANLIEQDHSLLTLNNSNQQLIQKIGNINGFSITQNKVFLQDNKLIISSFLKAHKKSEIVGIYIYKKDIINNKYYEKTINNYEIISDLEKKINSLNNFKGDIENKDLILDKNNNIVFIYEFRIGDILLVNLNQDLSTNWIQNIERNVNADNFYFKVIVQRRNLGLFYNKENNFLQVYFDNGMSGKETKNAVINLLNGKIEKYTNLEDDLKGTISGTQINLNKYFFMDADKKKIYTGLASF